MGKPTLEAVLDELDRREINLSLCDGNITTTPPAPPGLRNTVRLLESEVLAHLLGGSSQAVTPPGGLAEAVSDNAPYRTLPPADEKCARTHYQAWAAALLEPTGRARLRHQPDNAPHGTVWCCERLEDLIEARQQAETMGGTWAAESYAPPAPPTPLPLDVLELLSDYEAGSVADHVHRRLTALFETSPDDIEERLKRAARFVKRAA